jgi:hypothetical protein
MREAARALAAQNLAVVRRIDALLRSGALGAPGSGEAQRRAHRLARISLRNWYSFVEPFASDRGRVREAGPAAIAVLGGFCESGVFPAPRLRQLRMGRGRVCVRYDLGGPAEHGTTLMGGKRLGYRVADSTVDGMRQRLLSLEWRSASSGAVDILLAEHYCFRLEHQQIEDDSGAYELFVMADVSGAWLRRMGTHRPGAFAFWSTRPPGSGLPALPRIGSALHIPGLKFRLPVVPDINLDDLRQLALPLPFLAVEDLRRLPAWLALDGDGELADWAGLGPTPAAVRTRFGDR